MKSSSALNRKTGIQKWIMTQEWKDVLFLHWPVPEDEIKKHIPNELEADIFNGTAWISLVLFKVEGTRPRFFPPFPVVSSYLELNVRTYVKYKGKTGVYFFSLDANSSLVVKLTRIKHFLPYMKARMNYSVKNKRYIFDSVRTQKNQVSEELQVEFSPNSIKPLEKNQFDDWLTERYCLWTKVEDNLFRVDIQHSDWTLYPAEAEVKSNSMASFIDGSEWDAAPLVHYASYKKALFYMPIIEK